MTNMNHVYLVTGATSGIGEATARVSTTGGYFTKCRPGKPSALSQDPDLARKVWELSVDLLVTRGVASAAELAAPGY